MYIRTSNIKQLIFSGTTILHQSAARVSRNSPRFLNSLSLFEGGSFASETRKKSSLWTTGTRGMTIHMHVRARDDILWSFALAPSAFKKENVAPRCEDHSSARTSGWKNFLAPRACTWLFSLPRWHFFFFFIWLYALHRDSKYSREYGFEKIVILILYSFLVFWNLL